MKTNINGVELTLKFNRDFIANLDIIPGNFRIKFAGKPGIELDFAETYYVDQNQYSSIKNLYCNQLFEDINLSLTEDDVIEGIDEIFISDYTGKDLNLVECLDFSLIFDNGQKVIKAAKDVLSHTDLVVCNEISGRWFE